MKALQGNPSAAKGRFAIVAARFNAFVVDPMVDSARQALELHGIQAADITLVRVPGAYELPVAAEAIAASGKYSGIVALGAVIRGATSHFDYVAGECSRGIAQVGLKYSLPVIFGVLTTDDVDQALERAGSGAGNKGFDTSVAALQMIALLDRLRVE